MKQNERATGYTILPMVLLFTIGSVGRAQEPRAEMDGAAHARGFVAFKVTFPSRGSVAAVSLAISEDGQTYHSSLAGLLRGRPLFTSVADDGETTTVFVSVIGRFPYGVHSFLFPEAGTYYLRWGLGFEDNRAANFKIYQTVEVEPALEADLAFAERLADPDLLRRFFGEDFFDRLTESGHEFLGPGGADHRALSVIAELLKATRAKNPENAVRERKSAENARRWGETLFELAKELPESSYAPYAAFYASCCYYVCFATRIEPSLKGLPDVEKLSVVASKAVNDPDYAKACEAMAMATEHGDAYLKPLAMYHRAVLHVSTGDLDAVERLLEQADELAPGEGTVRTLTDRLRKRLNKERRRQAAANATEHGD